MGHILKLRSTLTGSIFKNCRTESLVHHYTWYKRWNTRWTGCRHLLMDTMRFIQACRRRATV